MRVINSLEISNFNNTVESSNSFLDSLIEKIDLVAKTAFSYVERFFNWASSYFFSEVELIGNSVENHALKQDCDYGDKLFIDSTKYKPLDEVFQSRKDFLDPANNYESQPPYIFRSHFIPKELAHNLMRCKRDVALGTKYKKGSAITNMEALLHSFVVPMCKIKALGDYQYNQGHFMLRPEEDFHQAKDMIMSATIHPDFEDESVMMKLACLSSEGVFGEFMDYKGFPSAKEKEDENFRLAYDQKLLKHAVCYLTAGRRKIALEEAELLSKQDAVAYLEQSLKDPDFDPKELEKKAFKASKDKVVSLDILYHFYKEQLANEFEFLDHLLENKYAYTLGPPSIFARALLGDEKLSSPAHSKSVKILLRLQAVAFKEHLKNREGFASNMACMGVENFADSSLLAIYQDIFDQLNRQDVKVSSRSDLLGSESYKTVVDSDGNPTTFVDHNCFDGFGQNIETEGDYGSKDGTYGVNTDAAHVLRRNRQDLLSKSFVTRC